MDSQSFLKRWSRKKSERYRPLRRDLIKKRAFGVNFALIGVENQELDKEAYDMIADDLEEDIEVLRPFYEKVKAQKD